MPNPLDFVSKKEVEELGLSPDEINNAYQPSQGGVYHCRGEEGTGKTLWIAHFVRDKIDSGEFSPSDCYGNITLKGKYSYGYHMLRGDELYQHLKDLYEKPLRHTITIISEIDLEFPARFFGTKEQTIIALGMWQMLKFDNYVLYDSHTGNSTDLIFHLASHYIVLPETPDFETQSLDFTLIDKLHQDVSYWTALDIIKTMLIYNRQETTASFKNMKQKKVKQENQERINDDFSLGFEEEESVLPRY